MTLDIAICDDLEHDSRYLKSLLVSYTISTNINLNIDIYASGKSLLQALKDGAHYHLLFMDIEMPEENGIDVAYKVKKNFNNSIFVVFTSNYPDYMHDSFKVHPYHFLQKPLNEVAVTDVMTDLISDITQNESFVMILESYGKDYAVNIPDILYIETVDSKNQQLLFHFSDKQLPSKGTLLEWQGKLQNFPFTLGSRKILINLSHISYLGDTEITLDNGDTLSISKRNKKVITEKYMEQIVSLKTRYINR
jgi:DNA-binding LytR/AlgR family response regulator